MKIKLYFFGKKNEITPREEELIKRIGFRSSLEIIPLAQAGVTDVSKAKQKEAEVLLGKINNKDFLVAFDEHGKELDSIQFSAQLKNWLVERSEVVFVIGGAHGLDESILARANVKLRFGQMVWTRNLFRLMALEQLYRALEIDGGGHFHKD